MRVPEERATEVFRPYRLLAFAMACAGALWIGVAVLLATFDDVHWKTWASVAFFICFFAVSTWYYWRSAIFVEGHSFTYRGFLRTRRCGLSDIRKLEIAPGLITVYSVRVSNQVMHFTSLFARHRTLAQLLVDRAGLASSGR